MFRLFYNSCKSIKCLKNVKTNLFADMAAVGRKKIESSFPNLDGQQEINEAFAMQKRYDERARRWINEDTKAKFIKSEADTENQESVTNEEKTSTNESEDIKETQEMQDSQEL